MTSAIDSNPVFYPALEVMHITGIALLVGNLVLVELRVWGRAPELPLQPLARIALTVSLVGFGIAAFSGSLMFATQAAEMLTNRAFVWKMGLLTLAGANAGLFHARDSLNKLDAIARWQTVLSLGLWLGVIICGPWIAYRRKEFAMQRRSIIVLGSLGLATRAFAHHGWSGFDQDRPVYLEGKVVKVSWRNPHVELQLELPADFKLPADLGKRPVPAQSASVDGAGLLSRAVLPTRRDKVWELELAPLTRMEAWKVPEIKTGESVSVLGFASAGEKGDAVVRVEYLFAGGKAYGLRSSPA